MIWNLLYRISSVIVGVRFEEYFFERNVIRLFGIPLSSMLSSMCIILVVVEPTVVSCPLQGKDSCPRN